MNNKFYIIPDKSLTRLLTECSKNNRCNNDTSKCKCLEECLDQVDQDIINKSIELINKDKNG